MNNNGRGASLTAPNGPAEQEAIADAVRNASISIFDVESVEAFGSGSFLADAIEVGSLMRGHRTEEVKDPLPITATKSSFGNQVETSGIVAFLKTLQSIEYGVMTPNIHLRQANPHIDTFDQPGELMTECCEYYMNSTFAGSMSRGSGGSNVYLLAWGQLNPEKMKCDPPPINREFLSFWPGGGGVLESEKRPSREYTIVGSWCQGPEPMPMEPEGEDAYGFTVTLGENRWEWFVILLDGDHNKVLHPGYPKASKDFPVLGPVPDNEGACWMISGKPECVYVTYDAGEEVAEGASHVTSDDYGKKVAMYRMPTADTGKPGDQYRVHLHVKGKWRTVTWERLVPAIGEGPVAAVPPQGRYYICGDWSDWDLEEMSQGSTPGAFYMDIEMGMKSHEFTIVRNKDWNQMIYPLQPTSVGDGNVDVRGPDDLGEGHHWHITGERGSHVRVEFQRTVDDDSDIMKVTWRKLDPAAVAQA